MNAMMRIKLSDTKTTCPFCGKEDFQPYSLENSYEILPYRGYCSSCGACITPLEYQFAQDQIIADYSKDYSSRALKNAGIKNNEAVPVKMLKRKFITAGLNNNNLFNYLTTKFARNKVKRICNIYGIATHKVGTWLGAAIFCQYNQDDQCQAVKIIQYNENGHRIKGDDLKDEGKDMLYQKPLSDKGKYCLFGRHLLNRPDSEGKPICIVESEKTAIIASIVYPEAIWMAAGSCYYLCDGKIDAGMRGRKIIIFPDADVKYEPIDIDEVTGKIKCINWYLIKASPYGLVLTNNKRISVSGFLESFLTDRCKECQNNKFCSSSPYYDVNEVPYTIENRKMGFMLNANPVITEIPKVVLDRLTEVSCEFRGCDIGDYIMWCKQNNEDIVNFETLIEPINDERIKKINDITSYFESKEKLFFQWWKETIRRGITERPKDLIENANDGNI